MEGRISAVRHNKCKSCKKLLSYHSLEKGENMPEIDSVPSGAKLSVAPHNLVHRKQHTTTRGATTACISVKTFHFFLNNLMFITLSILTTKIHPSREFGQ